MVMGSPQEENTDFALAIVKAKGKIHEANRKQTIYN